MGACILCGKSAGFFYALHKNCYQHYQTVVTGLVELLEQQLATQPLANVCARMRTQVDALEFTAEASQRCYVKALEQYAALPKQPLQALPVTANWLACIQMLALDEHMFVDPTLVQRQRNLPALRSLQAGQLPQFEATEQVAPATLESQETIWWVFRSGDLEQKNPAQKNWSIVAQLIDNLRPSKVNLVSQSLAQGTLWLTDMAIHIVPEQGVSAHNSVRIDYADIYSCTPASGGVSVQLKHSTAVAQALHCEDGRLLYQFILEGLKRREFGRKQI